MQVYHITSMHCPNCAAGVTGILRRLSGQPELDVKVDLAKQLVTTPEVEVNLDSLKAALDEAGFILHGKDSA